MKILVIQQKMIGDVLTSSILFEALRGTYPDAELHYLINSHTYPVVENNPFIDEFKFFTPEIEKSKRLFYSFLKQIRKEKYDVVIDVYGKWSSNFITYFSNANTKISYYKWYTKYFYTNAIKRKTETTNNNGLAIENRLQLLEPICENIPDFKPKTHLTAQEIETSKQFLINSKIDLKVPLFMISVLGSGSKKTYPLHYMAKLIDNIINHGHSQILFNYIPSQIEDAKAIFNHCRPETQKRIHFNVFGKSLREFIAISYHCDAIIGNEGGAINIAKAIDIPTFSIFSPWISKETWNIFENDSTNVSVHLKDYKPEIFEGKTTKQIKNNIDSYYLYFKPELIKNKLIVFLETL